MPQVSVRIEGLDELKKKIRQYPEISEKHLQKAVIEGMGVVERLSTRGMGIVPVDTGNLSNSFRFPGARDIGRMRGKITPQAKYAVYVNEGTKRMKPRKFMEKIAEQGQPEINKGFVRALDRITEEIASKN